MRKVDPRTIKQHYISGRRGGSLWGNIFKYGNQLYKPLEGFIKAYSTDILKDAPGVALAGINRGMFGKGVQQLAPDAQEKLNKRFSKLNAML